MPGLIELGALIVSSLATTVAGANLLYLGTYALAYAGLSVGATLLQSLFVQKPSVPRPEDGSYNLKQSVPSIPIVLGRVKKGGDYFFLEEKNGTAYHGLIEAGHRIHGYVQHYLHDEAITIDGSGAVIAPDHFTHFGDDNYVNLFTRTGLDTETAYANLVATFPEIWSSAHRGDGLATVCFSCDTIIAQVYLETYPNQMPQHSCVLDGALVFDPRNVLHDPDDHNTWGYAQNLALLRMHQLTQPWGGKQNLADLYWPDWAHAADVCDEAVLNRDGDSEPRYHGGLWFRANSDQIQVGRLLDQAAELVVYERPDGLIGVHAGEMVTPTLRLTEQDILSCSFKANRSEAATVLAVRGRFTDPEQTFNTVDAAIIGDPYIGEDTERTRTVDNQAVQSHNHIQRLQTIAKIRANAPRVAIRADYEAASDVGAHRFVRVHFPPKMNEAIVEITSTPKLSFSSMTVEFSGIVVPENLYAFTAATDEGVPPPKPVKVVSTGVPAPVGFNAVIATESVSGSTKAAYALATWTHVSSALLYEFEWQATTGPNQVAFSIMSKPGEDQVRSSYLADDTSYRFRLRAWSNGVPSGWTSYINRDVEVDPVAPGTPLSMSAVNASGTVTVSAKAANDNTRALVFKRGTTGQSFAAATLLDRYIVSPNQVISFADVPGTGTWKYWCGAENASGKPSAAQASITLTV
jgi:hypothetical protein